MSVLIKCDFCKTVLKHQDKVEFSGSYELYDDEEELTEEEIEFLKFGSSKHRKNNFRLSFDTCGDCASIYLKMIREAIENRR
mgnify:CR=1 FL=1|tara:strand:+ start:1503 stop:1748 length:246 start_codon:yes stop_codon:yes gene_type:complete